jgi:hypothetical protein
MIDPESQFEVALDAKHLLLLLPGSSLPEFDNKEINRINMEGKLGELISLVYNCRQIEQAERYIIGQKQNLEKALEDYENKEALLKKLVCLLQDCIL